MGRRERRNGNYNHNNCAWYDREDVDHRDRDRESLPISSPPSARSSGCAVGCIQHPVSKLDTLAGIAIKYGVEVADIKKMNGLVTDRQMFALNSLQIPLPGRHPPSPCLSNGSLTPGQSSSDHTPPRHVRSDFFESFQSLRVKSPQQRVSPAMSSLQGYYGLKPIEQKPAHEGFEMAVYRGGGSHYLEDGPFLSTSPPPNPPLSHHRKSKSLVNSLLDENGELADILPVAEADSDKRNEKLHRRRQKSEADFTSRTPDMLLEDNSNSGGFVAITGKGLALRSKAASRMTSTSDAEAGGLNPIPVGLGDSIVADSLSGVRKSSSTSSLQDQDNGGSLSIWTHSMWSLKPDLQAFSNAASAKPIFDGLPKPIPTRRNKTALD